MNDNKIGMNHAYINKEVHLGNKVGSFDTKKEAVDAAKSNEGSEIIYEKDNKWEVSEIKQKGVVLGGLSNIEKFHSKDEISFDTKLLKDKNMNKVEISFLEDDNNYVVPENRKQFLEQQGKEEPSNKPEDKNKIGVNYTFVNKDVILGKKLASFDSKEKAMAFAEKHSGSEIVYEKGNKWEVRDLKEKSVFGNLVNLHTNYAKDISFDTNKLSQKNMNNPEVSFTEEPKTKIEDNKKK
jgi:hypothetical protein